MAAISAESFECFLAGILVQQAFAFFRIELGGEELVASGTQMREPFYIFRAELFFELFSEALGKGRALPSGRNGDLQGPALHNGGIVEIAELGDIDCAGPLLRICALGVPWTMWPRQPKTFLQDRSDGKGADAIRWRSIAPRSVLGGWLQAQPRALDRRRPAGWRF